jgi:hypothetical protein
MDEPKPLSRNGTLAVGLLATGLGVVIVLGGAGVLPPPKRQPTPGWIVVLAGGLFLVAGLVMLIQGAAGGAPRGDLPSTSPRWVRAVQAALGVAMFASFALIASWVAFGPGPRSFSTNIPFLSGAAAEIAGRCAFGLGAVVIWLCTAAAAVAAWHKLRADPPS